MRFRQPPFPRRRRPFARAFRPRPIFLPPPPMRRPWGWEPEPVDREAEFGPADAERSARLPARCPSCDAPVRADEVRWLNETTAACAYCEGVIQAETGR